VLVPIIAAGYYGYRYYLNRQRRLAALATDTESSEPLNGYAEHKSPLQDELPWWNWRRWTASAEMNYFPLVDRSPPGRQHQRQRTE